jgi:4-amino-4-deoxy-L-arabinose transferase-like glycosyltransferase
VAAVEAAAWSFVLPPGQGPDELPHFAYTQRLVERGELPQAAEPGRSAYSSEVDAASRWAGIAATIGNPAARPSWTRVEERGFAKVSDAPRDDGTGANPARNNPPLYYLWQAAPYAAGSSGSFFTRIELMRLWNIPLLLAVIACTWLLIRELLPTPPWGAALGAGAVTLHPMLTQLGGIVNPDIMLAAIWSAFAYAAVLLVRRGPAPARLAAVGALVAASVLTHPRGLPLVVPAVAAVAISFMRHRRPSGRTLAGLGVVAGLAAVPVLAYFLSLGGESVVQNSAATGGGPFQLRELLSYVWQFYLPQLPSMTDTVLHQDFGYDRPFIRLFYGGFASHEVLFGEGIYDGLRWLTFAGLAGLVACGVRHRRQLGRNAGALAVLILMMVSLLGAIHYSEYRELANGSTPQIVGRYLIPLMPLFGLSVAFVVTSLPRRIALATGAALLAVGTLLQLGGLGLTISRFYA